MGESFRVAILSDLHAAPKSVPHSPGEVKLFTDQEHASATEHPMKGLEALIAKEKLTSDLVVCPGDMTNKANPEALQYVWQQLHSLKSLLKARAVVATVGNHDIDSRGHSNDSFPREALMRLRPHFPAGDERLSDRYWAHGFFIEDHGDVRVLVLNTCWLHESRDELDRGVLTDYTLESVRAELSVRKALPLNVAVFHHHPHPHSELGLGSDDVIRNGQRFLEMLSVDNQWLVIHGHKHHPKIEYSQGEHQRPVVFACGSFSGRLDDANALVSKNYFHVIEIDTKAGKLAGRIISWSWVPGFGWVRYPATPPAFPTETGFGCTTDIASLATTVKSLTQSGAAASWKDLVIQAPELRFLMPKQLSALVNALKSQHGLATLYDEQGRPTQLGKALEP